MLAEAIKRDWPIHLYVESKRLPGMLPMLLDGGHKVVIPHFGMFDRTLGPVRDPGFELLARDGQQRPGLGGAERRLPGRARAGAPGGAAAARRLRAAAR